MSDILLLVGGLVMIAIGVVAVLIWSYANQNKAKKK